MPDLVCSETCVACMLLAGGLGDTFHLAGTVVTPGPGMRTAPAEMRAR